MDPVVAPQIVFVQQPCCSTDCCSTPSFGCDGCKPSCDGCKPSCGGCKPSCKMPSCNMCHLPSCNICHLPSCDGCKLPSCDGCKLPPCNLPSCNLPCCNPKSCSISACLPACCLAMCTVPGAKCIKLTDQIVPNLAVAVRYALPSHSDLRSHIEALKGKAVSLTISLSALSSGGRAVCSWDLLAADRRPLPKAITMK